jgi:hypothetical protein
VVIFFENTELEEFKKEEVNTILDIASKNRLLTNLEMPVFKPSVPNRKTSRQTPSTNI